MAAAGWATRILNQGTQFVEDEPSVVAFSQYFKAHEDEILTFLGALSAAWQPQLNWLYLSVSTILICGGQPNQVYEQLRIAGLVKTGVCSHVWKQGDNAYRCRTCELDPLAVICMACFEKGNHKDHNYMLVGASGGCCDCGDEDSWKASGYCPDHTGFPENDPSLLLPADIRSRAHTVIRYWLSLVSKHFAGIDDSLRDFIAWLTRLLACGDGFRRIINQELFAAPTEGHENLLEALFLKDGELPDKTSQELHQFYYAVWVDTGFKRKFFTAYVRAYPKIIAAILKQPRDDPLDDAAPDPRMSLLEDLSVQMFAVHSLLVWATNEGPSVVTMLLECLEQLLAHAKPTPESAEHTRAASLALGDEIDLEHHIITNRQYSRCIRDLRYALSNMYAANRFVYTEDLFKRYLTLMTKIQALQRYIRITEGRHIEYENDSFIGGWELELHFLYNSKALQQGFRAGEAFVYVITTSLLRHSYITSGVSNVPPNPPLPPSGPPSAHLMPHVNVIFNTTLPAWLLWWLRSQRLVLSRLPEDARYWRVTTDEKGVSFHIPMHRTYAMFIESVIKQFGVAIENVFTLLCQHGDASPFTDAKSKASDLPPQALLILALEHVLRVQGLTAEVAAGMWRRNGVEMWAQSITYRSVHCSDLMLDTDVFFMQCAVIALGPAQVLAQALATFGLSKYFKCETDKNAEFHEEQLRIVAEEFLRLVIVLATDRTRIGHSEPELIRRELVHRLCAGDKSYSELSRNIPRTLVSHANFESILKEVSTYHVPQAMEQGSYQIKPACWVEYDRYFVHYDSSSVQAADERYAQAKKNPSSGLTADHLSVPVTRRPTLPPFARITSLLHCELLHRILFVILHNAVLDAPSTSDSMLAMSLYLLRQALESIEPLREATATTTGVFEVSAKSPTIWDLRLPGDQPLINARHRISLPGTPHESIVLLLLKLKSRSDAHAAEHKVSIERILALLEEKDPVSRKLMEDLRAATGASPAKVSEAERKRLARERQNAILAKFASQQKAFKGSGVFEMGEEDDADASKEAQAKKNEEEERRKMMPQCALCKEHTNSLVTSPIALVAFAQPSVVVHESNAHANKTLHPGKENAKPVKASPLRKKETTPASSPVDLPLLARHRRGGAELGDEEDDDEDDDDDEAQESENVIGEEEEDDDVERAAAYMENLIWGQVEGLPAPPPEFMEGDDDDDGEGDDDEDEEMGAAGDPAMPDLGEDFEEDDDDDDDDDDGTVPLSRPLDGSRGEALSQNLLQSILANIMPAAANAGEAPRRGAIFAGNANELFQELLNAPHHRHHQHHDDEDVPATPQPLRELVRDNNAEGVHLLFCGHQIHMECFDRYFSSLVKSHIDGNEYEGENIINLEQLEFLCPVCRRLSNTLVPLIPDTQLGTVLQPPPQVVSTPPEFDEWFRSTVQMFSSLPQPPAEHKPRFIPPTNALDNAIDAFVTRSVSVASSAGHESVTPDEDATPYVWNALSYTIAAYEQAVRQLPGDPPVAPLLAIPEATQNQWLAVFRVGLAHRRAAPPALNRPLHLNLLRALLAGVDKEELDHVSILDTDAFSALVRTVFLWPRHVDGAELRQMLRMHWLILTIQLAVDIAANKDLITSEPLPALSLTNNCFDSVRTLEQLVAFCHAVHTKTLNLDSIAMPGPRQAQPTVISTSQIAHTLRLHAMPFLRCAALFVRTFATLHHLVPVAAPPPPAETYEELLAFLGLPPLEAVVSELSSSQALVVLAWLRRPRKSTSLRSAAAIAFKLIDLPLLYTDIVAQYMSGICSTCNSSTNSVSALCLLCGDVVCADNCVHAHAELTADVGIFLHVSSTSVLLVRGERLATWGSPYLDEHGEEDIELRRGKPLRLNAARYAQLRRLWITQGIEHDSHVLAKTTLQGEVSF